MATAGAGARRDVAVAAQVQQRRADAEHLEAGSRARGVVHDAEHALGPRDDLGTWPVRTSVGSRRVARFPRTMMESS